MKNHMKNTPSVCTTSFTCRREKSFWILVVLHLKSAPRYWTCWNLIYFFKITFENNPNVQGVVFSSFGIWIWFSPIVRMFLWPELKILSTSIFLAKKRFSWSPQLSLSCWKSVRKMLLKAIVQFLNQLFFYFIFWFFMCLNLTWDILMKMSSTGTKLGFSAF